MLSSIAVVALACFNITFRLGLESVGEWDESLYATTAWEMTRSGDLIGTTFDGVLLGHYDGYGVYAVE